MKIWLTTVVFLFLFVAQAPAQFHLGTVEDHEFYSQALGKNTTVRVYLPPGYDADNSTQKYPVIITLHGPTVRYEVYSFMFPIIDALWLNQSIEPFILVMPDGKCGPFNGSFYTNSALYGAYEDLISEDIIQYVDSAFQTYGTREFRAIMGHSMGAYGAFKQLFRHPDLYCAIAAHSGPVHIEMLEMLIPGVLDENGSPPYDWQYLPGRGLTNLIFTMAGAFSPDTSAAIQVSFPLDQAGNILDSVMEKWNPHNIVAMVRWYMPQTELGIYFDCGYRDDYQLYLHNRALSDSLTFYGIRHEYIEYLGDHTSGLPLRIPVAFRFLDQQFRGNQLRISANEEENRKVVRILPNPAQKQVWYEPEDLNQLLSVSLMDCSGRYLKSWPPRIQPLDLTGINSGIYYLIFRYQDSVTTNKLVITD